MPVSSQLPTGQGISECNQRKTHLHARFCILDMDGKGIKNLFFLPLAAMLPTHAEDENPPVVELGPTR